MSSARSARTRPGRTSSTQSQPGAPAMPGGRRPSIPYDQEGQDVVGSQTFPLDSSAQSSATLPSPRTTDPVRNPPSGHTSDTNIPRISAHPPSDNSITHLRPSGLVRGVSIANPTVTQVQPVVTPAPFHTPSHSNATLRPFSVNKRPTSSVYSRASNRSARHRPKTTIPYAYLIKSNPNHAGLPGPDAHTAWYLQADPDRTKIVIDGFNQLSIIAVFFSSVQSQVLATTFNMSVTTAVEAANALIICGLLLNVFGAIYAALSARWFAILQEEDKEILNKCWAAAQAQAVDKELEKNDPNGVGSEKDDPAEEEESLPPVGINTKRERLVSIALYVPVVLVYLGFATFAAGILVLTWSGQPFAVSISATCTMVCIAFLPMYFLKHRKSNVIRLFNFARYAI